METSLRSAINHQLNEIISRHFQDLSQYVALSEHDGLQPPRYILENLERLAEICICPPQQASPDLYDEARRCHASLEAFLKHMNQEIDLSFKDTQLGRVWVRAAGWIRNASAQRYAISLRDVWRIIHPATPDCLIDLGHGRFEARWWKPVPMMDVEILLRTITVSIEGDPFEPGNLPGGLAVRFTVFPSSSESPGGESDEDR